MEKIIAAGWQNKVDEKRQLWEQMVVMKVADTGFHTKNVVRALSSIWIPVLG